MTSVPRHSCRGVAEHILSFRSLQCVHGNGMVCVDRGSKSAEPPSPQKMSASSACAPTFASPKIRASPAELSPLVSLYNSFALKNYTKVPRTVTSDSRLLRICAGLCENDLIHPGGTPKTPTSYTFQNEEIVTSPALPTAHRNPQMYNTDNNT